MEDERAAAQDLPARSQDPIQLGEDGGRVVDVFEHLIEQDAIESTVLDRDVGEGADIVERGVARVELREVGRLVPGVSEQLPVRSAPGARVEHQHLGAGVPRELLVDPVEPNPGRVDEASCRSASGSFPEHRTSIAKRVSVSSVFEFRCSCDPAR